MFPPKAVKWMEEQEKKRNGVDLRAVLKKAYKKTVVYQLDQLLEEERRWGRKVTLAHNKLKVVRRRINRLSQELAQSSIAVKANNVQ